MAAWILCAWNRQYNKGIARGGLGEHRERGEQCLNFEKTRLRAAG